MGYACPVCETPQADGEHLANHLAFTAMLGDDDHEEWLDDHAPGWGDEDPESLAPRVTPHVPEEEFPQLFEDTSGGHDHDHGRPSEASLEDHLGNRGGRRGRGDLTDEHADVMAEARRLTEQMLDDEGDATGDGDADGADDNETE